MGKKLLILGVGAQGSTVARRMNEETNVHRIICADHDAKAVESIVSELGAKAVAAQVDASDKESIIRAAEGADLIINGLPLRWHGNVLDAALEVKANYQDFAATDALADDWIDSIRILYDEYGPKFEAIDRTAIVGTGSAPGLICAATRRAVRELDTCDTINNIVYEGVETKRFLPFWWSPVTALSDMSEEAYAVKDGALIHTPAFGLEITREYDYMGVGPITLGEHSHDEPVHYWFNKDSFFKGVKNVNFKYGGYGYEFAKPLYRAGLLSKEKESIPGTTRNPLELRSGLRLGGRNDRVFTQSGTDTGVDAGVEVAPFDVVLAHVPAAPKYREEIQAILDEGLVMDTGCMVIEAFGEKDGQKVLVETHVFAPGLADSFARAGLTAEMYLTGQGGALFTKMFIEEKYTQRGLISSDMITDKQVDYYFKQAAGLGIELRTTIKKL
jgi:saccharopine dehydrogenase-like NADP-dependent oxidoreductase